jgi:hypothetical protein
MYHAQFLEGRGALEPPSLSSSATVELCCFLDSTMQKSTRIVHLEALGHLVQHYIIRIVFNTLNVVDSVGLNSSHAMGVEHLWTGRVGEGESIKALTTLTNRYIPHIRMICIPLISTPLMCKSIVCTPVMCTPVTCKRAPCKHKPRTSAPCMLMPCTP